MGGIVLNTIYNAYTYNKEVIGIRREDWNLILCPWWQGPTTWVKLGAKPWPEGHEISDPNTWFTYDECVIIWSKCFDESLISQMDGNFKWSARELEDFIQDNSIVISEILGRTIL